LFGGKGNDQYCSSRADFSKNTDKMGTISSGVVWATNTVFPIPDGYDSADAAPLLCAGSTVFTVLTGPEVKSTDRIGVMGVGGLGHLAIKLAAAMGHDVVALSTSESKRQEALDYGATEFLVYDSEKSAPPGFKPLNHLLLCGNTASKNFNKYTISFHTTALYMNHFTNANMVVLLNFWLSMAQYTH
jgi:D-arabinose 1-dehydrogenase-like Zn-dependent alcohol dehydrogenase